MAPLTDWVRRLVLLVIVLSFVELLAPQNGLKRYVQLVVGFVILTAVLTPLVSLVRGSDGLSDAIESLGRGLSGARETPDAGQSLAETNERLAMDLAAERLVTYLETELGRSAGTRVGVAVRLDEAGGVSRLSLTAPPGQGEKLRTEAARLAGVEPQTILVVEEAIP